MKLSKKGLTPEQIYFNLKDSKKFNEPIDLMEIYEEVRKFNYCSHILGTSDRSWHLGTRVFGALCLAAGLFVYSHFHEEYDASRGKGKVKGYAVMLCLAGSVLIIKPRFRVED